MGPMLQFAAWAGRADYHWPLEVFTVNYDLLVETAFEQSRLPYFDGFVGNIQARFHTDLVEGTPEEPGRWILPSFVRLWKLHGSVNWAWDTSAEAEIVRMGSGFPLRPGRRGFESGFSGLVDFRDRRTGILEIF